MDSPTYYCHVCCEAVSISNENQPICSVCESDFIEIIEQSTPTHPRNDNIQFHAVNLFDLISQMSPSNAQGAAFQPNPMLLGIASLLHQSMNNSIMNDDDNHHGHLFQSFFMPSGTNPAANPGNYAFGDNFDQIIQQLLNQAGTSNQPPAASEKDLEHLKIVSFTDLPIDTKDCSICQEVFSNSQVIKQIPCGHLFHQECIEYWLKLNGTCPFCRYNLVGIDEKIQKEKDDLHKKERDDLMFG